MPTILLSLELRDQASAATRAVTQAMDLLDVATRKASAGVDLLEVATKRAGDQLDYMAGKARVATLAMGQLTDAVSSLGRALNTQVAGLDAAGRSADATTSAIRRQIGAVADLSTVTRLYAGSMPAGGGAVGTVRTVTSTAQTAEQAALAGRMGRAGTVLGAGIAGEVGLGGRVLNAALGPEGLLAGGLLYGGYKAVQQSNQFQSALASLAAVTNQPFSAMSPIAQSTLAYTGGGTSQYSPTQVVQGGQQFLAAQVPSNVYAQIAPYIAQGSAVLKQPDMQLLATATTDLADAFGKGRDTSVTAFKAFADMGVAADQFAKANPGALILNMAKILSVAAVAGVSAPEALAYTIKETLSGESTRFSATNFAALISNVSLRAQPTQAQQQAASALGVEIGPKALADYGGLSNWLQAVFKGAQNDPNRAADLYSLTGTRNAFRGIAELAQGAGTQQFRDITQTLKDSSGGIPRNFKTLIDNSPQAQWLGVTNEFKTDLTNSGKALADTFQPAVEGAARGLLDWANTLGGNLGQVGNALDQAARLANLPQSGLAQGLGATGHVFDRLAATIPGVASGTGFGVRDFFGWTGLVPPSKPTTLPAGFIGPPTPQETRVPVRVLPEGFVGPLSPGETRLTAPQGQNPSIFGFRTGSETFGSGALMSNAIGLSTGSLGVPPVPAAPTYPGAPVYAQGGAFNPTAGDVRLARVSESSAAYNRLVMDAQSADKAHTDLVNKIAAGLPVDNVTRQLGVYDAALTKLSSDLHVYQTDQASLGLKGTVPGISDKTITADQTSTGKAVGQYGYTLGKTNFDISRQEYLAGQIGLPQFHTAEQAALTAARGDTGVSGAQRRYLAYSISSQYDKATGSVARQQEVAADQLKVQAAQQNLDAAQQMSKIPSDWKTQMDAYLAAQRQLIADEQKTGLLTPAQAALQLRNVNQQGAAYGKTTSDYNVTRRQKDLQDAIDLAKTQGNLGAQAKAQQALYGYDVAHAKQLGLSPADLALIKAQQQADLRGSLTPIPPPFRQNQPGLGALAAGPGGTAVRFGGGQDPQLEEIRQLRQENERLRQQLAGVPGYLAQIARNTADQARRRGAAPPQ